VKAIAEKEYRNAGNRALLQFIDSAPGVALDIGCGGGDNAKLLHTEGWTVDGITISGAEKNSAQQYCRNVWIHDLEEGLPREAQQESYGLIVCSHVLEHLRHPERVLAGLRPILRPDGVILVALPNIMYYRTRLALSRGVFQYTDEGIMDHTHYRWFTFSSAQTLLQQAGFRVIRAEGAGGFPLPGLRRLLPWRLSHWIDRTASRISPGLFSVQLLYKACP